MLPSLLTRNIQQGIKQFLTTGFEPSDAFFSGLMQRFVEDESAWMKGPYLQLGLPFRPGASGREFFAGFTTEHPAFIHQEVAWQRLSSQKQAANTLVATGTGSGKTECFLYPLLDHVLRAHQNGERGIKALVIYPMNALATDQARRFAEVIYSTPELRGLRVGLFVGGQSSNAGEGMMMAAENVIFDQNTLRANPPDILLTNYKMLDYLLIRPKDRKLWAHNGPTTLRYLVVDELHTFDGAQGTDLAMLIRRLRARLHIPTEHLICAGTSATLGGASGLEPLCTYAGEIFGSPFTPEAVITENRQSVADFLANAPVEHFLNWDDSSKALLNPSLYLTQEEAIAAWFGVFFPDLPAPPDVNQDEWRMELGNHLKSHVLFSNLVKITKGDTLAIDTLYAELKGLSEAARRHIGPILDALLALVAWARNSETVKLPLITLRTQLWMRELRRMVTNLTPNPNEVVLVSEKDLSANRDELYLPLVQCTNCHSSAWLTRLVGGRNTVLLNLDEIYNGWFSGNSDVVRLYPHKIASKQLPVEGGNNLLCCSCGHLQGNGTTCAECESDRLLSVFRTTGTTTSQRGNVQINYHDDTCPDCGSKNRQILLGARNATLGAQVVEHTWASPFNDDKKLIAFSDSVQDAAHRAGFFTARTYANTVRTAIAKALDYLDGPELTWSNFLLRLGALWQEQGSPLFMDAERFVAEFIGPNMQWQHDWVNELLAKGYLPLKSRLPERVQKRLCWQAIAEFTYLSQRGRNLDRIGKATLAPNAQALNKAAEQLISIFANKLGIHNISSREIFQWLWGFIAHLRRRGAVLNPELNNYIEDAKIYAFAQVRPRNEWLPPMGDRTPRPIFLTLGTHAEFDRLSGGRQKTWYENWFAACMGSQALIAEGVCTAAYREAIHNLALANILTITASERFGESVGINPDALFIMQNVCWLSTQDEKRRLTVPQSVAESLIGMPVLDSAQNTYQKISKIDPWLANRFSVGDLRRVIAAEHTGLLEREEREQLEIRFKSKAPRPWYENLLSATPTLEMGVDIGSLSSVLLCSVPPNQASFLQRIGRAGRRDGNAMTTTLADGGSPHDLYFFAEPTEMLAGDVTPPGIFLQAPEVLRRQLMAFCMDDWVASGISDSALPEKTSSAITAIEQYDEKRFPYLLKNYIAQHQDRLLTNFITLLGSDSSANIIKRLTDYYQGSDEITSIGNRLIAVFEALQKEKATLKKRADALRDSLNTLKKQPKDEAVNAELAKLQRERDGVLAIIREIDQRDVLNTLADEGLIPNYAFPEAGIELKSILWRRKGTDESSANSYIALPALKYERPAASALSEFAPENRFYANQRRVEVNQINMSLGGTEIWRLCPNCQYAENTAISADCHEVCPKCGDPMWKNVTQRRLLLRFRQAIANSDDTKVRIDDSAEEREPKFYERQLLTHFEPINVKHAWQIKSNSAPFGFEFISKVDFRDINFGEAGGNADRFRIADKDVARPGFRVCKQCGTVQKPPRRATNREQENQSSQDHAFDCPLRSSAEADNIVECLFLYREFSSEALRILVPFSRTGIDERVIQSFMAAIQLGLKKRFGGKVDHLRMIAQDEPSTNGAARRHYVLIYDSVPGGTGYLDQLLSANAQTLTDVLRLAYDALRGCGCNLHPDKDGCYRCLYQYRLGKAMEKVSRRCAEELLEDLLEASTQLEKIDNISEIFINPQFDSVLEARFIECFKRMSGQHNFPSLRLEREIIKGKSGYLLCTNDERYRIEPQVNLGLSEGVAYPSKPDFVIWPVKARTNRRPIAIFCDGWQYHQDKFRDDARKRSALVLSGNFWVWSVTSEDVEAALLGELNSALASPIDTFSNNDGSRMPNSIKPKNELFEHNAVALLIRWLITDSDNNDQYLDDMRRHAAALSFRMFNPINNQDELIKQRKNQTEFWVNLPNWMQDFPAQSEPIISPPHLNPEVRMMWPRCYATAAFENTLSPGVILIGENSISQPDELRRAWRYWLYLFNWLQVLPGMLLVSQSGLEQDDYNILGNYTSLNYSINEPAGAQSQEWNSICDGVFSVLVQGVRALQAAGLSPPDEVGFEIENNGSPLLAELAWFKCKLLVLIEEQHEYVTHWETLGWHVVVAKNDWHLLVQSLLTDDEEEAE